MSNSFTKTSSQTISYAHNNLYDGFGTELTISFWIKVSSWNQLSGVISKRSNASNTISYAVSLYNFFYPTMYLIVGNGAGGTFCQYSIDTIDFPVDEWIHIVATYDSTLTANNRIKIYANGIPQVTTPDAESTPLIGNVNFQLYLGRDNEAGSQYLNGSLAEVGVWSRALVNQDVAALARGFRPDMINRSALRFYSSLLGRRTYDAKNFFLPSSISAVPVDDHPRIINRLSPSSNVFFAGGEFAGPSDTPSYAGHKCMIVYINRSETFDANISRNRAFNLDGG